MRRPLSLLLAAGLLAAAAPAFADHRGHDGARVELRIIIGDPYGYRGGGVIVHRDEYRGHRGDRPGYYDARKHERARKHRREDRPRAHHYREVRRDFRGDRRFLGYTAREIREELRYRGFRRIRIDPDRDEFEIEARRGGIEWEIEVSRRSGRVTAIEFDD